MGNIFPLPFTTTEDTSGATVLTGDPAPSCAFNVDKTVWFKLTVTEPTVVRLQTTGSNFDTVLAAYAKVSDTFVEVACDDDSGF